MENPDTGESGSLPRGNEVAISFTSATQVWQFTVRNEAIGEPAFLAAAVVGGTGTTGIGLEASLDGPNWFSIAPRTVITSGGSTAAALYSTTTLNTDPAVIAAASWDVSGLTHAAAMNTG